MLISSFVTFCCSPPGAANFFSISGLLRNDLFFCNTCLKSTSFRYAIRTSILNRNILNRHVAENRRIVFHLVLNTLGIVFFSIHLNFNIFAIYVQIKATMSSRCCLYLLGFLAFVAAGAIITIYLYCFLQLATVSSTLKVYIIIDFFLSKPGRHTKKFDKFPVVFGI